jgi:FkbM family methyltransferase
MIKNSIKSYIKRILKKYNLKLIKLNTRKNKVHPYSKPSIISLKCILDSSGILHIGAHRGTEASAYDWLHKKVLWIEANPTISEDLSENINKYFDQKYICALVGDENKKNVDFYISNNDAACSSIFDFSKNVKNKMLWNDRNFAMTEKIKLNMHTLDNIFEMNNLNPRDYSHWIFDIQGAEYLALKGARKILKYCKSLEIEVSKKQYYEGGARWDEIKKFLENENFVLVDYPKKDHTEVLFIKKNYYELIKYFKVNDQKTN